MGFFPVGLKPGFQSRAPLPPPRPGCRTHKNNQWRFDFQLLASGGYLVNAKPAAGRGRVRVCGGWELRWKSWWGKRNQRCPRSWVPRKGWESLSNYCLSVCLCVCISLPLSVLSLHFCCSRNSVNADSFEKACILSESEQILFYFNFFPLGIRRTAKLRSKFISHLLWALKHEPLTLSDCAVGKSTLMLCCHPGFIDQSSLLALCSLGS